MFKLLTNLTKAAIRTATLPVAAVVDVVTLGGAVTDDESAIGKTVKAISNDCKRAMEDDGD